MDPVGEENTLPGTMHLILVGFTVVFIFLLMPLLGIGFYQVYGWRFFGVFTFFCLAVIVFSGIAAPIVTRRGIEVMGLAEQITGNTFNIWVFVMAYDGVGRT